jgi:hypothetical protein
MASLAALRAHREADRVAREDLGIECPPSSPTPVVRHGSVRITIEIGGTPYSVTPRPIPENTGLKALLVLTKRDGSRQRYALAVNTEESHCTCPDHVERNASCKHMMALQSIARLLAPLSASATPTPTPTPRPTPTPAAAPAPPRPKARKPKVRTTVVLPEGWQPGGAALPPGGNEICDSCGCEFDPMKSGHHSLCGPCAKVGD